MFLSSFDAVPFTHRSSLNFAVTDGESVVVTRFRSGSDDGPSLYITHTSRYHVDAIHHDLRHNAQEQIRRHKSFVNVKKQQNNTQVNSCKDTVIVCSEPLDYDRRDWTLVPNNNMVEMAMKKMMARKMAKKMRMKAMRV